MPPRRLPGLDLLRAVAIVWVMLFHSWMVGGLDAHFSGLQDTGWMGVDLFFVLSGYLIGGQLLRPLSRGEPLRFVSFYVRRSYRVLPAFAVVLGLYFLVPGFNREGRLGPLWEFLTYSVNLFIDYDRAPGFSHAWSLCVEEHFYVVFPLIAWLLTRRTSAALTVGFAAAIFVGGMLLRGALWVHGQDRFLEVIYYPTWCRLDGLLAGVIVAAIQIYRPDAWAWCRRHANDVALPAGLAILTLAIYLCRDRVGRPATVFGYPLLAMAFALLVVAGASPSGLLARMAIPGVQWVAAISYSLYLIHKAIFKLVERALPAWSGEHQVLTFVLYATTTLAGGALLHYLIERPFLALRDRKQRALPLPVEAARAAAESAH